MILQHYSNARKAGFKNRYEMTGYVPEGGESDEEARPEETSTSSGEQEERGK